MKGRLQSIRDLYRVLDDLRKACGGPLMLAACTGRMSWPRRGVYFFFEKGEQRSNSGDGPRVVRVGTHALGAGSNTKLWNRLSQHAGSRNSGAGNHRGSIFRLLVGEAMKRSDRNEEPRSWGVRGDAASAARELGTTAEAIQQSEVVLERAVSTYIGAMPFLFVAVEDDAGPESNRGRIERGAIALLSNYGREAIDPPSKTWLGRFSGRERVRGSGLWNNNHVDEAWDQEFLDRLVAAVKVTGSPA